MDELQPTTKDEVSVESEWKRVEQLLDSKEESAWALAVVESFKIFHQVLDEVSFGKTAEEKINPITKPQACVKVKVQCLVAIFFRSKVHAFPRCQLA